MDQPGTIPFPKRHQVLHICSPLSFSRFIDWSFNHKRKHWIHKFSFRSSFKTKQRWKVKSCRKNVFISNTCSKQYIFSTYMGACAMHWCSQDRKLYMQIVYVYIIYIYLIFICSSSNSYKFGWLLEVQRPISYKVLFSVVPHVSIKWFTLNSTPLASSWPTLSSTRAFFSAFRSRLHSLAKQIKTNTVSFWILLG